MKKIKRTQKSEPLKKHDWHEDQVAEKWRREAVRGTGKGFAEETEKGVVKAPAKALLGGEEIERIDGERENNFESESETESEFGLGSALG